jgi:hypothetical protein
VCDLVFVVGDIRPLHEARESFARLDAGLAAFHFDVGIKNHEKYVKSSYARTYVADKDRSYLPCPAVPIEEALEAVWREEWPLRHPGKQLPKPLDSLCRLPTPLMPIIAMDDLEEMVWWGTSRHRHGPLPSPPIDA